MSTRTDWGWFKADGTSITVGDAWWKWLCPQRKWIPSGYEHPYTGEWVDEGNVLEPVWACPIESLGQKEEMCLRCGNKFTYP